MARKASWAKSRDVLIETLQSTSNNISSACKRAGISRPTFYAWLKKYPELQQVYEEGEETRLDFAESKMMVLVAEGFWPAIKYLLSTKGKKRGYIESQEIINKDAIEVDFTKA